MHLTGKKSVCSETDVNVIDLKDWDVMVGYYRASLDTHEYTDLLYSPLHISFLFIKMALRQQSVGRPSLTLLYIYAPARASTITHTYNPSSPKQTHSGRSCYSLCACISVRECLFMCTRNNGTLCAERGHA